MWRLRIIVCLIPISKLLQAFSQYDFRRKPKVTLQFRSVGICSRHIPWLHGHQLLVGINIKLVYY